jgi:hypothetical protein
MSIDQNKREVMRLWDNVWERSISKIATYSALNRQFRNSYRRSKLVTFTEEAADQVLFIDVQNELAKQPHKSFSDLCKESLRKSLPVPEPTDTRYQASPMEKQIAELQEKVVSLERQVSAREARRLDVLESQLNQLALQQAHLAITMDHRNASLPTVGPVLETIIEGDATDHALPQQADPLLRRIGSLLEEF